MHMVNFKYEYKIYYILRLHSRFFSHEFLDPPEKIEISDKSITLAEGKKSEKILCTAEAYPEAHYEWHFNEKASLIKCHVLVLHYLKVFLSLY